MENGIYFYPGSSRRRTSPTWTCLGDSWATGSPSGRGTSYEQIKKKHFHTAHFISPQNKMLFFAESPRLRPGPAEAGGGKPVQGRRRQRLRRSEVGGEKRAEKKLSIIRSRGFSASPPLCLQGPAAVSIDCKGL